MVSVVNAIFELVALVLAVGSLVKIERDRKVSGVYWPQLAWTAAWAVECVPYYYSVGHYLCAAIALCRCFVTLLWLSNLWRYTR